MRSGTATATGEALAQQTAISDILRVAASSSTDLQAVVNAVVQSAIQVGGADVAAVHVRAGDMLRSVACTLPEMGGGVQPLARDGVNGRAILEARTIQRSSPG